METIAVYWEPLIKTYGIVERTGLRMLSWIIALTDALKAYRQLELLEQGCGDIVLSLARPKRDGRLQLHLVVDNPSAQTGQKPRDVLASTENAPPPMQRPVDLIFFQGPHYGDRYGIAEAALKALVSNQVPLLAASCCGSAIYMVLPPGKTGPARKALSAAFVVPQVQKSKKGR